METITLEQLPDIEYDDFQKGSNSASVSVCLQEDINPVYLAIESQVYEEDIHVLPTRAYLDIMLNDVQIEQLRQFDEQNIHHVIENSEEWFGKPFPEEVVREYYHPLLNQRKKDGRYYCRFKINTSVNLPLLRLDSIYRNHKQELLEVVTTQITSIESIQYQPMTLFIELRGLQFGKKNFMCDCSFHRIEQLHYREENNNLPPKKESFSVTQEGKEEQKNNNTLSTISTIQQEVAEELSELLPMELDKVISHENFSIRPQFPPVVENYSYDFVSGDISNLPQNQEYNQKRKKVLLHRQSKYMIALEKLKTNVEKEVEMALHRKEQVFQKYTEALSYYQELEHQQLFDPNDELLEEEILEQQGRLTPTFTFEEES